MIVTVWTSQVVLVLLILIPLTRAGSKNQKQLEKMLLAGLVAKALAKGGESGGGGGGGVAGAQYVPIPVPVHHGHHAGAVRSGGMQASYSHHHHIHHKYVPIPVKHHTNFIIAHHKVHVPVKVPYPVYKTKVVHVPVEQTKVVPIIVNSPAKSESRPYKRPRYSSDYRSPPSSHKQYYRNQRPRKTRYSSQSIPRRWIVVVKHKHRQFPGSSMSSMSSLKRTSPAT